MAEKQGFFRRIFSFGSAPEDERVPPKGEAPRSADTEVGSTPGAPDPDYHQVAAADTTVDTEAGAGPHDSDGRITPLVPRDAAPSGADTPQAPAPQPAGMAEKKTSDPSLTR